MFLCLGTFIISLLYIPPGCVYIDPKVMSPLCYEYDCISTRDKFLYSPQVIYPWCFQNTQFSPEYVFY